MTLDKKLELQEQIRNIITLLDMTRDALYDEDLTEVNRTYKAAQKAFRQFGSELHRECLLNT